MLAYVVVLDWIAQLISAVPSVQETAGPVKKHFVNPLFSNFIIYFFLLYTGDPEVLEYHIVPVGLVSGISPGVVSQHGRMPLDGNTSSDFLSRFSSYRSLEISMVLGKRLLTSW